MRSFLLADEAQTLSLAGRLASLFRENDIILLFGDLGAGKTCFVRGAAEYFGCADQVASPTFTLVNQYDGDGMTLYHFDLYRISDEQELIESGADELFYAGGVSLIEWPQVALELLECADVSRIEIEYLPEGRKLSVSGALEERISW